MRAGLVLEQLYAPVPGGIGAYVEALCRLLPSMAGAGDEVLGVSAFHRRRPHVGLPVVRIPLPARPVTAAWQFLRRPALPSGFDAVLAPSLAVPPPGRASLVVFCADVAFLRVPEAYPAWGRAFHRRGLANARSDAAVVLTCSEASAADLRELGGIGGDRVRVIPLGVDPPAVSEEQAGRRRDRLGLPQGPYFLWVGTREPRKNLTRVLDAATRLLDLDERWVLAGPRGWMVSEVERDVSRRGLDGRVHLLGQVDRADLSALYRGATALCFPSLYEGFGLPVAEAMAHGVPVVTSDVSSLPEVAGGAGVLVDPRDPDAIAKGLRRLAEDSDERQARIDAGHRHVARFTWEASAAATWAALKECAA